MTGDYYSVEKLISLSWELNTQIRFSLKPSSRMWVADFQTGQGLLNQPRADRAPQSSSNHLVGKRGLNSDVGNVLWAAMLFWSSFYLDHCMEECQQTSVHFVYCFGTSQSPFTVGLSLPLDLGDLEQSIRFCQNCAP